MTRAWSRFFAVVIVFACGGEKTTEPIPPVAPPASLRLVFPDTVTRGVAFPLTVTALDAQGQTNASWTGTVVLTTSAGAISPASVNVVNGALTVQATIRDFAGEVSLTSSVASASGTRSALVLSGQPAARLVIQPQTFLLTAAGASQALSLRVLDADGFPTLAGGVTWHSTKAGVVAMSAIGVATATGFGSSTITARTGTLTSEPALGVVTTPAAGVVLVPDEQIVGGITPVNPQARYGPGWQYRVRMTGTPPQIGQVIAARGEKPVAGRVTAVQGAGVAGSDVTLQLVAIDQVFSNLSIDETGPLNFVLEKPALSGTRRRAPWAIVEDTMSIGSFKCEYKVETATNNPFALSGFIYDLTPTLQYSWIYNATRKRIVVQGGLTGSLKVTPTVTAALNGSLECKAQVGQPIPIPIGGALSVFFGARVPVGLGFALEGGITLATLGFDIEASVGTTLSMGIDCNPDCLTGGVFNLTGSASGNVKPNLPQISTDFRVTAAISGFAWADLEFGPSDLLPGAENHQLNILEAKAGVKQEFNLSTADVQAADADYASSYSLAPFFNGGVPSGIQQAIDSLLGMAGIGLPPLKYESAGSPLAQSPAGSFQIVPSRVMAAGPSLPGDTATFIVDLSRTNYLTQYAVESVKLFRKPSANGSLVPAPGSCASITPTTPAQSLFTCKTDLPVSMSGEQTFYAFVKPIFGVALPVLLEVASDAKGTVMVDTTRVVYESAFNGVIDTVWSHRTGETSPSGQRYLGKFANEGVKLSLANLPAHSKVVVELDLYIVDSWDGSNTTKPGNGPDIVTITLGDSTVLHSTFSNVNGVADHRQSYPDRYPGPLHDAATGAISKNTLGYPEGSAHHNRDSIYRFRFEVTHSAGAIILQVKGTNITPPPDEWWGIDNIRVTVR